MQSEFLKAREKLKKKLMQNAHRTINEVLKANLNGLTEIGLFGSLVKNDFNSRSDSDIYLLFHDAIPDRQTKGYLRSIAEENNCDLIFLTEKDFYERTGNLLYNLISENRMVLWRGDTNDSEYYYHIAMNDLDYLNAVKDLPYYNQHCITCQQIGEKLLKHIVYLSYPGDDKDKILKSHSLRTIYRSIRKDIPSFSLPEEELANLTDYYFDVKYPGIDFFTATKEDFLKCYSSLLKIVDEVNRIIEA